MEKKIVYLMHGVAVFLKEDRGDFNEYSKYLVRQGFVVCNLNYRLIPEVFHEQLNYDIYATASMDVIVPRYIHAINMVWMIIDSAIRR